MTDAEIATALRGAAASIEWMLTNKTSDKVLHTLAGLAADSLAAVRDAIGEQLPKSRIKIDDLPIVAEKGGE